LDRKADISVEEYCALDALTLADLIRRGEVTAENLLQAALLRLEQSAQVNAVAHLFSEPVAARPCGREARFAGVPFLAKDIALQLRGTRLTLASALFAGATCADDDTLARRLKEAGLVIFGRTNMAEMGLGVVTAPKSFGPTRNPWAPDYNAGGSSGGAAAAVAAGIVPFAHATDAFGSIRVPASHCGVFGFKPSRMRVPMGPGIAEALAGMSSVHCVSRSVRDSAVLLDATNGPDQGDPYAAVDMRGSCEAAIGEEPRRLRIAFCVDGPGGIAVDGAIQKIVRDVADHLSQLGHELIEMAIPGDAEQLQRIMRVIAGTTALASAKARMRVLGLDRLDSFVEPATAGWIEDAAVLGALDYLEAVQAMHRAGRQVGQFFSVYDAYLSPTTAELPVAANRPAPQTSAALMDEIFRHAPFTGIYNIAGAPAMSVPAGMSTSGLPVGAQIGAAPGADRLLFALAAQIERTRPWPLLAAPAAA
jgi:amidase